MVSGKKSPARKKPRHKSGAQKRKIAAERKRKGGREHFWHKWHRDYKIRTGHEFSHVRNRAVTSRRQFFRMKLREDRCWHEMLADAPSEYHPAWIDMIQDPEKRTHLRQVYLQMREEQDEGDGVTVLRDLLLRRMLWCSRIAERLEGVMEEARAKQGKEKAKYWEPRLHRAERYYSHLTEVMLDLAFHLHRTGPKAKKRKAPSGGRIGAGAVEVPVDD